MITEDEKDYDNGYKARSKGLFKNACPFGVRSFRRRCWWLAGFNDKDLEMKQKGKRHE